MARFRNDHAEDRVVPTLGYVLVPVGGTVTVPDDEWHHWEAGGWTPLDPAPQPDPEPEPAPEPEPQVPAAVPAPAAAAPKPSPVPVPAPSAPEAAPAPSEDQS